MTIYRNIFSCTSRKDNTFKTKIAIGQWYFFFHFFFRDTDFWMDSLYSVLKFYRISLNFYSIHKYLSWTTVSRGRNSRTLYFFMLDYGWPKTVLNFQLVTLRLHYVPGDHGSHGSPKRSAPCDLVSFCLETQVLLGIITILKGYQGIRYKPWAEPPETRRQRYV